MVWIVGAEVTRLKYFWERFILGEEVSLVTSAPTILEHAHTVSVPVPPLGQYGDYDDRPRKHQATGFRHRVNAQYLFQIPDRQRAEQSQTDATTPAAQSRATDNDDRNRGQFVAHARFRVALLFLGCLANAGHRGEEPAGRVGKDLREFHPNPGQPCGFFVSTDGIQLPAPEMARESNPSQHRAEEEDHGYDCHISTQNA